MHTVRGTLKMPASGCMKMTSHIIFQLTGNPYSQPQRCSEIILTTMKKMLMPTMGQPRLRLPISSSNMMNMVLTTRSAGRELDMRKALNCSQSSIT